MSILKRLFDFYLNSSIHVALSCYALIRITFHLFPETTNNAVAYFVFFGTIVGYNFVKYDALARIQKIEMRHELKAIAVLSLISAIATGYFFFALQLRTQIIAVLLLTVTLLYTLPFFPNRSNARNWAGIKIYMVTICWLGATLVLPIIDAAIPITSDFYLKCLQRFLLVFSLVLIFEIIDLKKDDPHLKTVPQQIGMKRTKWLGYLLMILFFLLAIYDGTNDMVTVDGFVMPLQLFIAITIVGFLYYANEKQTRYYTSFWAESIPIFWWLMLVLFKM